MTVMTVMCVPRALSAWAYFRVSFFNYRPEQRCVSFGQFGIRLALGYFVVTAKHGLYDAMQVN